MTIITSAEIERREKIKQIFSDLFCELNKMGGENELAAVLKETLDKEHRTLQQNYFRYVVVASINAFAEKKRKQMYDLRNEASCNLAEQLEVTVKDAYLPFV